MRVERLESSGRPPHFGGTVAEQGNQLPTVKDPGADARMNELRGRDPAFDVGAFVGRVHLVFGALQTAWSGRDLSAVRGYVGDNLFEGLSAQLDQQAAAGVRNLTERTRVLRVDLANVLSDRWYDAITVRVFATGLDYTLDARGSVIAGSKTRERPYTEYWTFLRARGKSGASRTDPVCPNCGAPLKVNAAGHCDYCRAKITTGEFDWVLSRIEQDDAYRG